MTIEPVPMSTPMIDVMADYLAAEGIGTVFGIPGGLLYPFFDHIERDPRFTLVVTKHEAGAAFMADGYARITGRPAVAAATSGPGATNLITGVAAAFADGVPMVVITGQASSFHLGKGASQEAWREDIDIVAMMRPITKYSAMVMTPDHLPRHFRRAMRMAMAGRPGPVHLNVPVDYWCRPVDDGLWHGPVAYRARGFASDDAGIEQAAALIADAARPVLLVGSGSASPQARLETLKFAESLNMPVATTPRAKGLFPEDHPLSLGVFGFAGHHGAKDAVFSPDTDVLVTAGASLNETTTLNWSSAVVDGKALVQIDVDPERIGRNYPVDVPVVGHLESVLPRLCSAVLARNPGRLPFDERTSGGPAGASRFADAAMRVSEARPVAPQRWRADLAEVLPEDAIVVSDIGGHMLFNIHHLSIGRQQSFILNLGFGSMGHGTAAPVGVALGAPGRPVVAIIGDGCFTMNGMDLLTAVEYDIPVIWIVENNFRHNITWHASKMQSGGRPLASSTYRRPPEIASLARAMGLGVWEVDGPGQMQKAFTQAWESGLPSLIEVRADQQISPPVGDRVETVAGFKK